MTNSRERENKRQYVYPADLVYYWLLFHFSWRIWSSAILSVTTAVWWCFICHMWADISLRTSVGLYVVFRRVRSVYTEHACLLISAHFFSVGVPFWAICITLHPRELLRPSRLLRSFPSVAEKTFEYRVDMVTFEAGPPPAEINTLTLV